MGQAVSWLATILLLRLLSPDDYGLMAMAGLFVGFLMLVGDLGVGAAAIQAPALPPQELRQLFGLIILTNLLGAIVTFGSAPIVAAFFLEPRVVPVLRALSVGFVLSAWYALPQSLLVRELRFDLKGKAEVLATVLSALTSASLALLGFGVWSLVAGMLSMHAIRAVAFQVLRPCLMLPKLSLATARDPLRFGGLVTLDRILWFLYSNLDLVIAGRVLGNSLLGMYSVALSLASMPLEKIVPVITQVSFAAFARIQSDRQRVQRNVIRALEAVSLVAFPTFFGMAVVAPEFVPLLLGAKWVDTVVPFQLLCLILPLKALSALLPPALFGTGQPRVNVINMAVTLGIMSVAFLVGVRHGIVGISLAWVSAYPAAFCITTWRALTALGIPIKDTLLVLKFPVGATLVMVIGLSIFRLVLGPALEPVALLGALILVGVGIYGVMVVAFNRHILQIFGSLIRADK